MELSYSFHLGNDSNKTIKARREAKNTLSGTTNKSNNAIQNVRQLGKVNHHNLRLYDNKQELIKTIKGSNDITKDVKELYLELFDEARVEYNNKQTRDDRKIDNYFNKISNDTKHDLACEIVIELGDMVYWDDKSLEYKYEMTQIFEKQIDDLKEIVPDFYIANATIHFDENSPHMHIIGVPVKENCKTGMEKQVGKTSIFTKESLVVIQDKMRSKCIEEFNLAYSKDNKLKKKEKGKNRDYSAYERLKFNEKAEKLKQELNELREDVSELKDNKQKINEEIIELNNDKEDIKKEIDKKKKVNNKIVVKSKNKMQDQINKLTEENSHLKWENKYIKEKYDKLEEKTNYLIYHLNKVFKKLPEFIQKIVEKMFNNKVYSLFSFKHDYDPDVIAERKKETILAEQEREKQYSYNYYYEDEEELEKDNDDGMEL